MIKPAFLYVSTQKEKIKMKKLFLGLTITALAISSQSYAAPITSALDPALAGATVEDFEAGPTGNFVSQSFSGFTVSAVNYTDTPFATFSVDSDFTGGYNTRGLYHITNHGTEFQSLRFDFSAPTAAFGFLFGASDSSWTLSAYDAGNTLLDTTSIPAVFSSNAGDFFGLKGLTNASYATLVQNFDGIYSGGGVDYVFVDNFAVAAVPEPETYAMLLAGLGLLGFTMRRKSS